MTTELETILARLKARTNRSSARLAPPYLYLDPESVDYLFQELTGLPEPPPVRYRDSAGGERDRQGAPSSGHLLFEAMAPVLMEKVPLVESVDDLEPLPYRYARVTGTMQATRFPDGNLNLEIEFAGIRGLLFYTPRYFNSLIRPLIADDRFYSLMVDVEALVFVHGGLEETIFYHQSYGDNQAHQWLPLVPVAVWNRNSDEKDGGGGLGFLVD